MILDRLHHGGMNTTRSLTQTRIWLVLFSTALIASGLSAILVRQGLQWLSPFYIQGSILNRLWPSMAAWLSLVHGAVEETYDKYPFLAYGYDWLAFGHFIIAIPFLMALRDPLHQSWVISYGFYACLAVLPFALLFGALRGIPLFWQGVDIMFGVGGLIVLLILRRQMKALKEADRPS